MTTNQQILNNVQRFIKSEGYRHTYVAKLMKCSTDELTSYLNGTQEDIELFAMQLAERLGYEKTYFTDPDFALPQYVDVRKRLPASFEQQLTPSAKEGLKHIMRICDLIDVYIIN